MKSFRPATRTRPTYGTGFAAVCPRLSPVDNRGLRLGTSEASLFASEGQWSAAHAGQPG